jgi:hypothetical protein
VPFIPRHYLDRFPKIPVLSASTSSNGPALAQGQQLRAAPSNGYATGQNGAGAAQGGGQGAVVDLSGVKVPQADNVQLFGHDQKIKRLQRVQADGGDENKSLLKVRFARYLAAHIIFSKLACRMSLCFRLLLFKHQRASTHIHCYMINIKHTARTSKLLHDKYKNKKTTYTLLHDKYKNTQNARTHCYMMRIISHTYRRGARPRRHCRVCRHRSPTTSCNACCVWHTVVSCE